MIGIIIHPGTVPTTEEVEFDSDMLSAETLLECQRTDHCYIKELEVHGYKLRLFYSNTFKDTDMSNPLASLMCSQTIKGNALLIDSDKNIAKRELEAILKLIQNP